jgi:ribosomal protein S18 acetylase RimI-like enzyme
MSNLSFTIRPSGAADAPALGRLGAMLLRDHYAFDAKRFMSPGDSPEEGYAWFLNSQRRARDAVVLVAELHDTKAVVGYVYAAMEPMSWKELRDAAGFIHDVAVDPSARRRGIATALMQAAIAWLRAHGAPRVLLGTAEQNVEAQRLFASLGFRRTMIEMTKEIDT